MIAALSSSVLAGSNAAGTWKGHITLDTSKMQKQKDPKVQAQIMDSLKKAASVTINLTLKPNKTYSATTTGGPVANQPPDTGTWSQTGNSVTMTSTKKKTPAKSDTQTLTMSPNGKTMSLTLPSMMGIVAKVVFSR